MIILKETNEYYNQRIDCNVENCKFHDGANRRCTLGKILVDGTSNKKNTFCDSFQASEDE